MNAVFVAKRQVMKKIFEGVDAALGKELGALRADAFDHADFGG
jgi:putative heme iron utilization protein